MLLSYLVLVSSAFTIAAGIDCSPPTDDDCKGIIDSEILHPWPCNCHRYWQCTDGHMVGHDCQPYSLVFDPLVEQCVYEYSAPPGICTSTPDGPTTTSKPTTTTEAPTTTTPKPTTTTRAPTTPATSCFACPACTCENPPSQENFFRPTPGTDCHEYYECIHNSPERPDCEWISVGYDCGDWIFNPNQASCASPDFAQCNE